ncbi:MAG: hypothetical protein IPK67_18650 [Planctomycetes bacterium]|nr:hypothetical protein [Planctomycetota bacterium]
MLGTLRALRWPVFQMAGEDLPESAFKLPFPRFVAETCAWISSFDWSDCSDHVLFTFVRALKGHPAMKAASAEQAYAEVMELQRRSPKVIVVPETDLVGEDAAVAFHKMWEKVRFPMGSDPVEVACGLAGQGIIKTRKERPGRYPTFLTVAALLQLQRREQPILLPARKLAARMKCQPVTISSWTGWAIDDGVLVKTKAHVFRSAGGSKAAEYVFGLHMWPRESLERLAGLLGLATRAANLTWIRQQFDATEEERTLKARVRQGD